MPRKHRSKPLIGSSQKRSFVICLAMCLLGVAVCFATIGFMFVNGGSLQHLLLGCAGTDEWLASCECNQSFWLAAELVRVMANTDAVWNKTAASLTDQAGQPPAQLLIGTPVDCESISNMIMCISERFPNVTCSFYQQASTSPEITSPAIIGHLGISCQTEEGTWRKLY